MPIRLLRPALRQSKRWNRVGYLEQTLYIRLLMLVDDHGRYDADPELIRSECFPFGDPIGQPIPLEVVETALVALAVCDLLQMYQHAEHRYLQLSRWQERRRSGSRWPDPKKGEMLSFDSNCAQMTAPTTTTTTTTTTTPSPSPSTNIGLVKETSSVVPESEALEAVKMNGKGKTALELMDLARSVLGDEELKKCHRRWSERAMKHPEELRNILHETKAAKAERRLRGSPGRYAEGACKVAGI